VDRFDRRHVMMVADVARAFLVAAIPLLLAAGYLSGLGLGLLAFTIAVFTTAFMPARDALVPELVGKEKLTQANAVVQSSLYLAYLVGAIAAAAALPLVKVEGLFYIDALSYLVSFVCIWWIKKARDRWHAPRPDLETRVSPFRSLSEALALAVRDGRIRGLLVITAIDNFFIMGPAIVGMPIYVRDYLHHGPIGLAAVNSAFAAGMIVGSIILHRWGRRFAKGRTILVAIVFDGLTYIPFMWISTLGAAMVAIFIHALVIPFIIIPRTTLVQEIVSPGMQGRMFSMINLAVIGLTALSSALTGIVAEWIPVPQIYAIIGASAALVGLGGWTQRDFRQAE
jgi:DHA3 family macrolide efflux protein-like MFS transporter